MDMGNVTRPRAKTPHISSSVVAAVFLAAIMFLSLVLNLFVCIAVIWCRRLRLATSVFVVNLCLADLLITFFSMSVWLAVHVEGQRVYVTMLKHPYIGSLWITVDIFCGTLSILSLTAISVDKYIAITRPLTYKTEITKKRNAIVVALLWVYSIIAASIYWTKRDLSLVYWKVMVHIIVLICFIIPLLIILTAYGKIYMIAKLHAQMMNSQAGRKKAKEIKAAKTISIVIGTFCVCWAPYFIITTLYTHRVSAPLYIGNGIKWLTYLNAFLNPLIYTLLDRRFRTVFLERTLCCLSQNTELSGQRNESSSEATSSELRGMSSIIKHTHKISNSETTSATQC